MSLKRTSNIIFALFLILGLFIGPNLKLAHAAGLATSTYGTPATSWNTFVGGAGNDVGGSIAVDSAGNIYAAGTSNANWGNPVVPYSGSDGHRDGFVAKLDSSGNLLWNTFMGSSTDNEIMGVALDSQGNVYVVGDGSSTWGTPINGFAGINDVFVAKFDSTDGSRIWNTFLGGTNYDYGIAIAADTNGGIYVTGLSADTWGTPKTAFASPAGTYDGFAAKLDSDGALQWNTFIGGSDFDWSYAIAVDTTGQHVFVTGDSYSTWGTPVNPFVPGSSDDAFVAKLDASDGTREWNTFLGGLGSVNGLGIVVDGSGNSYISGYSDSTWGAPVNAFSGGTSDAFIAKLNGSGALQWNTFLGGTDRDSGWGITLDGDYNLFVTGYSLSTWGAPLNAYHFGKDAFIAQLTTAGNLLWNTFIGGTGEEASYSIATGGTGVIYILGDTTATFGSPIHSYGGFHDVYVASYPKPTFLISGNAGVAGATVDYTEGSVTADSGGNYSITIPYNWSGTVTPSKTAYSFIPASRSYTNVTSNKTGEDYAANTPMGEGMYDGMDSSWAYVGNWANLTTSGPYANTLNYSSTIGDYALFTMSGSQFTLYYAQYTNRGLIDVYVDNVKVHTIDSLGSLVWQDSWTSGNLGAGTHTLKFVHASGTMIDMDAIRVLPLDTTPPAAITNLAADQGAGNGSVNLTWTAPGDDNNTGTATSYLVRYATTPILSQANWNAASPFAGSIPTPKAAGGSESMVVNGLTPSTLYYFAVRAQDEVPNLGNLSNSPSATATYIASQGSGMYDGMDSSWTYVGNWANLTTSGPYANTLNYSSSIGDYAVFTMSGSQFTLYYAQYSNRGLIDVYVDNVKVHTINSLGSLMWQDSWTSGDLGAGTHTLKFVHVSGTMIDIDAIQVLPVGVGTYDGMHSSWTYVGNWANLTTSGPYANTLNYSSTIGDYATFTMSGGQFTLYYAQYTNRGLIDVYVDNVKVHTIDSSGSLMWQDTWTSGNLGAGIHTLKFVHVSGTYIDMDAIRVLPVPGSVGTYDGMDSSWTYVGNWANLTTSGPYANTLNYSSTIGDYALFTMNGSQFTLYYAQYTNRGLIDVYVDNVKVHTIDSSGSLMWQDSWTSGNLGAGTHNLKFVHVSGTYIDMDAIQVLPAPAGLGTYDGMNSSWTYVGNWANLTTLGPYANTLNYSSTVGDYALFSMSGSQFTLYYAQYSNRGLIDVYVDNVKVTTIDSSGSLMWQDSWTSGNLGAGTHNLKFVHVSGTMIDMDAIRVLPTPAGVGTYDGMHSSWTYVGNWANLTTSGPYANTLNYSSTIGDYALFSMSGSQFTLYYAQYTNRGLIDVYVDNVKVHTIDSSGSLVWQDTWTSGNLGAGTHNLKFVHVSGTMIDMDAIQIMP